MTRSISLLGCITSLVLLAGGAQAEQARLTVFAAASMKNAMDEIAAGYEAETGNAVDVSLAGSSALARQIQQGARADIFISANTDWMDRLEAGGQIDGDSRVDLLGNAIVLVAASGAAPVEIAPGMDLAALLNGGRLAMALVDAVPAGIYGKAALQSLGEWDSVAPMVAQADNVRAALALVATGAAPMGIVYATDAVAEDDVHVIGTFPEDSHPPIIYPAARVAGSDNPLDAGFLAYLQGAAARAAFERQGFVVLAQE
ncbi:molybdate ABC transporter substrate-binding protein [Pseudooceanicola sediminis]|uniref:Molybdate-binding protein ModA n=1 Tax=Pseudooceanicola sediminis TaxID=2211117 RepID=A0A399J1W1_9RHOB|nr:molybdate ABC transporter substrate-binding protein [Pseudooceanicola sediminis]KAA2314722.1 molybdate ABC transporter substrate-binding protein [Puniceibacterium sp. HSS470]RII39325.1 molybdate ABC transporter substrate-binding protein [Pseudooceanicola sediminis]|tara:strand:- start:172069 stop:172842 length:774 start_codon:yes stop_codon:yes gene_type:complete